MIAFCLWLLATLDAAFTGYREAAGRNALIDKRRYYRRAMLRGALFGQLAVLIAAVVVLITLTVASDRRLLISDFERAGAHMLWVYLPYAGIILIAFAIRLFPSVDIRSITSTIVFGPLTLVRPLVAIGGVAYGIVAAPRIATVVLGLLILSMMLSLERAMSTARKLRKG
jgi:hypothetical protein